MLINYYLGMAVILTGWLVFLLVFFALWKKVVGKKQSLGAGIGFFAGIVLSAGLFFWSRNVYVVTGKKEYTKYLSFGGGSYTLKDGKKIAVKDIPFLACGVINDTPERLVVEKVVYGNGVAKDILIEPGRLEHSKADESRIDYFFDDEPDGHVVTDRNKKNVVKLWLRTEEDYGYGVYESKEEFKSSLNRLRDRLNNTPDNDPEE